MQDENIYFNLRRMPITLDIFEDTKFICDFQVSWQSIVKLRNVKLSTYSIIT